MTYYLKTVYFQQICYNFVTRPVVCPMSSALTAGSYTVTRYTAVSCANNTPGVLLSACLLSNTQYPIYIYIYIYIYICIVTKTCTRCTVQNQQVYPRCSKHCIVMPAGTVLLFHPNHFYWCVLPYVYYYSCTSRAKVAGRVLYTLMFTAIAERHGVQGWALKATSSCGTVSWWWIICTLFANLRCITQTLSIKQSLGQDVPASSCESSGSSGA